MIQLPILPRDVALGYHLKQTNKKMPSKSLNLSIFSHFLKFKTLLGFILPKSLVYFQLKIEFVLFHPSLIAQLVKNLPAMHETTEQFLGWEDRLE